MGIVKPEWAVEHPSQPLEIFVGTLSATALLLCWSGLYYGVKFYERLQLEREATLGSPRSRRRRSSRCCATS